MILLLFATELSKLVTEYGRACERRMLEWLCKQLLVTVNKEKGTGWYVCLNWGNTEEMECFRYLVVDMTVDRIKGTEVSHRVGEGGAKVGCSKECVEGKFSIC